MSSEAELFKERLFETIAWCSARMNATDPVRSLRTAELKPYLFHDREIPKEVRAKMTEQQGGDLTKRDAYDEEAWFQFMMGAGEESWLELTGTLSQKRRELLKVNYSDFNSSNINLSMGKLLFYEDDRSELDGESGKASNGFLNSCDVAPWDTWVMYVPKNYALERHGAVLISWIPPEFVPLVEKGVEATEDAVLFLLNAIPDFSKAYQTWQQNRES